LGVTEEIHERVRQCVHLQKIKSSFVSYNHDIEVLHLTLSCEDCKQGLYYSSSEDRFVFVEEG